jgi:carbon storage regulator
MLVLTRKSGEEIVVGKNIRVRVLRVGKGRVHLGISAPHDVAVHRQEVVRKIEKQASPLVMSPVQDGAMPEGAREISIADLDLEQRVRDVLFNHGVTGSEQVAVDACSGVVTLSGNLPSVHEKWLCTECCRHVSGVQRVVDELQVSESPVQVHARK